MQNEKIIIMLNDHLIDSINLVEINHNSSLINTRKTLEYIVNSVYSREKLVKPVNEKGYTELSNLIDVLKKMRKISPELADLMHKLRKNGNDAAHFNNKKPQKSTALKNIKLLCKVLVWFLKKYDLCENSLYLLAHRRANIKILQRGNKSVYHLNESLTKLSRLSILKSSKTIKGLLDEIPKRILFDKELTNYFNCLNELVAEYFKAGEYADYTGSWLNNFIRKLKGRKRITQREFFLSLNEPRIDYLKKVKMTVKKRYLL